jgi:lysine-specific demethylase 8
MLKRLDRRRRDALQELRGVVADWPAVRRWSLDYLRRACASTAVTAAAVNGGKVVMDEQKGLLHTGWPMAEVIDALCAGAGDRYIMAPLDELPDAVCRDVPPPSYAAAASWRTAKLWISAAGTVSGMHRDLADNLHAQVSGRKRFTLVAPQQSALLYPNGILDGVPNGCRVDVEAPDLRRFPKLRDVRMLVADLEPGDAIYIPRRWWHQVRTLDLSISVNYWWASGGRRLLVLAADYFKRVRGISR